MSWQERNRPVIAAVIRREERYLICKRAEHKKHGGLWEFPGGKLEPGESFLEAAVRELKEELNLTVLQVGAALLAVSDTGEVATASAQFKYKSNSPDLCHSGFLINFLPVETSGEPVLIEHQELRWLTGAQLQSLSLAPSDRVFVEHLNRHFKS